MTTKAPEIRAGSLVSALGVGQICSWGSLYYSFPLIAEAMGVEFGWSKIDLYGAATLGLILAALLAYPVGVAVDRGYGRWVMGSASLAAGVLLLLWSRVETLAAFYLLIAGVGALQAATLYEPAFAVIARRVGPLRARRGIIALTLWGGFASTVFIPLVQWLLDRWGWRDALVALALVNIVVCGGAHFGYIRPGHDALAAEHTHSKEQAVLNRRAVQAALRHPVFWLLLIAFTAYTAMFSIFTFHMYPMLLERGLDTTLAVEAIAFFGPAQVVGRAVIGIFATKISMRTIGAVVAASFPLTFGALIVLPPRFWPVAMICLVFGVVNGIFTIVRGIAVPEMLSRRAYGTINGALTVPTNLARAAAPVGAAYLWSVGGSYGSVLVGILSCTVILAVSFWLAAWLSRPMHAAAGAR